MLSSGARSIFWWRGWRHFTAALFLVLQSGVRGVFWWHGRRHFTAAFFLVLTSGVRCISWWHGWRHFTAASFSCATLRCMWSVLVTRQMPNFLMPRLACTAFWTSIKTPSESTSTFQPQVCMQVPVLSLSPLQGRRMVQSHKPCPTSPLLGSLFSGVPTLDDWLCGHACPLIVELLVSK